MATEQTDKELLRRFRAGDDRAFTEFYHRHKSSLYFYLMTITGNAIWAAELLQDLFIKVTTKTEQVAGASDIRSYLYRVAWNLYTDRKRKEAGYLKTLRDAADAFDLLQPRPALMESEVENKKAKEFSTAITQLPEEERNVLFLKFYGNLEFRQIGEILDLPKRTLYRRYQNALDLLRNELKKANIIE